MTDKQMIIDGVDVSGCVQFIQDEKDCCNLGGSCKGWTNCYYKNWKRKEQECERLKDIIETKLEDANICDTGLNYINDEYIFVKRQLDQLKAENEGLKRLIAKQKNAKIQLSKLKDKQYKEFCDMKQTLTEIKEIANPYNDMSGNCVIVNCFEDMYKILQKISEVLE